LLRHVHDLLGLDLTPETDRGDGAVNWGSGRRDALVPASAYLVRRLFDELIYA
jgi:hypothetical protein